MIIRYTQQVKQMRNTRLHHLNLLSVKNKRIMIFNTSKTFVMLFIFLAGYSVVHVS